MRRYNMCIKLFFSLITVVMFVSCKKFIAVDVPVTKVSEISAYNSDATAIAVLTGIYSKISSTTANQIGFPTLTKFAGLSADELTLFGSVTTESLLAYYQNKLTAEAGTGGELWISLYSYIYTTNAAIEGLNTATSLTPKIKEQLLGESYFLRGLFYYYLVGLYGELPLALTTSYETNNRLSKVSVKIVYSQIISDLSKAKEYLSQSYLDGTLLKTTSDRVRPTKYAASALLAKAYLSMGDWLKAYDESNYVISSGKYSLTNLNSTFLKNSNEAIWQIQPVVTGYNTQEAVLFILPSNGPNISLNNVYLSDNLMNAFEAGDLRKKSWVSSVTVSSTIYYYPTKYKDNTFNSSITNVAALSEYLMMLRFSEQYLVRAEASFHLGNITDAINDINIVRKRARAVPDALVPNPLPDIASSLSESEFKRSIIHERQVELFTEWGNRWLDLKRENIIDSVMSVVTHQKGETWLPFQSLYPIPKSEIEKNNNIEQNKGYQN